ncbi:flagellar basal-body MS-ring/collar protein FliF [Pelagibaculum spongiae]|uniref:Flagellar M-ring protein n=1 Tax=Pelagibaculum spongiae TaxID=2080658 RepID=A0A2V1GRX4_9GAMM|nr:flagellar basal-body MS-ring/collar protein FliF [Pelagibaculum spongiae]PVZ66724.1 flagellar basal body M-ring protein FliF [Pelagibaculum spongiae]
MADSTAAATADTNIQAGSPAPDRKIPLPGFLGKLAALWTGISELPILRQLGLMVGLAASVALGVAVVLWSQQPEKRVLFTRLDNQQMTEVMDAMERLRFPYSVDQSTGFLMVDAEKLQSVRLKLAAEGVPSTPTTGFAAMQQEESSLGTSMFMERKRYMHSLQQELATTITSLDAVRSARIHLAVPRDAVFIRDRRKPSASVMLDLISGRRLERSQVQAIVNMVSTSIPELTADKVTVVDQRGRLLSSDIEKDPLEVSERQFDYRKKVEQAYIERIQDILRPVLGDKAFKTQVTADMDFSSAERAEEKYNPNQSAVRSEQWNEEEKVGDSLNGGIPGALSNQPPGGSVAPEQAAAEGAEGAVVPLKKSRQGTKNYEVDRTVSYVRGPVGSLSRLSVAVVIDDFKQIVNGETQQTALTTQQLDRITALVRDAVGFSQNRGDSVTVINTAFAPLPQEIIPEAAPWYQMLLDPSVMRYLLALLVVLILVFGLLRPVMRGLAGDTNKLPAEHELDPDLLDENGDLRDDKITLTGSTDLQLPAPEDSYQAQLNAIKALAMDDPGRVAIVLRQWMKEGE